MKKKTLIKLIVILSSILLLATLFIIKKNTLTKEVIDYLTIEKGYEESEFTTEGFFIDKGKPQFNIKVSFKDEKDFLFLYGKFENKIIQKTWLSNNNKKPQKHIEINILNDQ